MRCNTEQLPPKTYQLAIVLLCGGNCVAGQQISNGATNDGLKRVKGTVSLYRPSWFLKITQDVGSNG